MTNRLRSLVAAGIMAAGSMVLAQPAQAAAASRDCSWWSIIDAVNEVCPGATIDFVVNYDWGCEVWITCYM